MEWGRPDKLPLLSCVVAFRTRNVSEHYGKDTEVFTSGVREALPAIRSVLSFFRRHAEIPHLRLLPRSIPLVVLTRFFALYPDPSPRTLELLTRWTWRTLLSTSFFDERTVLRHGVATIMEGDEEMSVQRLLSLVPRQRRAPYSLPARFDARAAESRLAILGLASLHPLEVERALPVDVAALIEKDDVSAFRRILPTDDKLGSSPANRILLPGSGSARKEIADHVEEHGAGSPVLRSHALSPAAVAALVERDTKDFIAERGSLIEQAVNLLGDRLAGWSRTDRPSIAYLLEQAGAAD